MTFNEWMKWRVMCQSQALNCSVCIDFSLHLNFKEKFITLDNILICLSHLQTLGIRNKKQHTGARNYWIITCNDYNVLYTISMRHYWAIELSLLPKDKFKWNFKQTLNPSNVLKSCYVIGDCIFTSLLPLFGE